MVKFTAVFFAACLTGVVSARPTDIERRVIDDVVVTREDLNEIFGRELVDRLEERDPFGLGLLFKGAKLAFKAVQKIRHKRSLVEDDLSEREDELDLVDRDFDDEEDLLEREYYEDLD